MNETTPGDNGWAGMPARGGGGGGYPVMPSVVRHFENGIEITPEQMMYRNMLARYQDILSELRVIRTLLEEINDGSPTTGHDHE
jgi:hypothetical protein